MNFTKKLVFALLVLTLILQPFTVVLAARETTPRPADIMVDAPDAFIAPLPVVAPSIAPSVTTPDITVPVAPATPITDVVNNSVTTDQNTTNTDSIDRTQRNRTPADSKNSRTVDSRNVDTSTSASVASLSSTPELRYNPQNSTQISKTNINKKNGSLDYSYDISIPQGRNGLTPQLTLSYNSSANAEVSPFGNGWNISIPSVKRINRYGVEKMYDATSEIFSSSIDGELVLVDALAHTYRPKVDNGDFRVYTYVNNVWTFANKDGSVYTLGNTAQARQDDTANVNRVYAWMLETITDTNANNIKFNYYKETGQIYPDSISYGIFNIVFTRENRTSILSSYNAGFNITTSKRISEVRADINNIWSKKYSFTYKNADNGQDTLLNTITESGKDENTNAITTKPATSFDYTVSTPGWSYASNFKLGISVSDPNISSGVRFGDINGDGLQDEAYAKIIGSSVGSGVFLNNGTTGPSSQSSVWQLVIPFADNTGVQNGTLMDVNADGLADVIAANRVYLNNGVNGWTPTPNFGSGISMAGYDTGVRLADVNGDGLVDELQGFGSIYTCGNGQASFLNNGSNFIYNTSWQLPNDVNRTGCIEAFTVQTDRYPQQQASIIDIDGDGLPDIVDNNNVYLNNTKTRVNLLKNITSSTGATTNIEYKPSTQYKDANNNLLNNHLPYIVDTVAKITTIDTVNNISSRNEYTYSGGEQYYKSAYEKEFAGFEKVEENTYDNITNTLLKKNISYFHQGDADSVYPIKNSTLSTLGESADTKAKIGKVFRTEIYDNANNLYQVDITKWDSVNIAVGTDFVFPAQTLSRLTNGGAKDIATSYTYNTTNGDLNSQTNFGEVTGNNDGSFSDVGNDKYITNYTYAISADNKIHLPSSEIVTNQNNVKEKENQYFYDALSLGSVTKGNNTKTSSWISGANYSSSQNVYNAYGLKTSSIDPNGNVTNYAYDAYNLYPASITNPLSQNTNYTYDYSSGKPLSVTDINGKVYTYTYDGLDRTLTENIPDVASGASVLKTSYIYTDTPNANSVKKSSYLDVLNSVDSYQYFDGLGRAIQTRTESETGYNVTDTIYDALGRTLKTSLPYSAAGSARGAPTGDTTLYTINTYDTLNRPLANTNALGTTSFTYNGWKTTVTDANSKTKSYYKDAYDNLVRVDEINSGSTYSTNYVWNLNKNLLNITDALGNIRNFTYDNLGRRLTAQDLHTPSDTTFGIYYYTYDNAGNLTQTINPNAKTINYTYNTINQQLTEDETSVAGVEISYTYGGCANGVGKLCNADRGLASTGESKTLSVYTYDNLGNIANETKNISAINYTTNYTYDRLGNNITLTTPDLAVTQYTYNTAGMLEKVERSENGVAIFTPVVTNFDYSPTGQIILQTNANGVTTTNTYDANAMYRLTRKFTQNSSAVKLQDLSYTYDNIGNITKLVDATNSSSIKTTNYVYDDLYRLLSASATTATQNLYTENYTYDILGNILNKNGQVYKYEGNLGTNYANPHALTSITDGRIVTTYTYDKDGNLLNDGKTSYTWNYKDQLAQTTKGSVINTYLYDHTGQRVKASNINTINPRGRTPATTITTFTVYPNKYYNIDQASKKTKSLFGGSTLLVNTETIGAITTPYYIHTDHLNSTNVITNNLGANIEMLDYFPYGNIRLDTKASTFTSQRKYIGEQFDDSTSLNYLNARYYNSSRGQFISEDPVFWEIGLTKDGKNVLLNPQSQNSYSYAGNNPINASDPSGRISGILAFDILAGLLLPNVAYSPAVGEENKTNYALEGKITLMGFATPNGEINSAKNAIVNNTDDAIRIISNESRVLTNIERQGVSNLIENSTLKNIFKYSFKESDKYPGGTAGAIKFTKETLIKVGNSDHLEKGKGFLNGLNKILNNSSANQTDKLIAKTLSTQLKKALKGGQ